MSEAPASRSLANLPLPGMAVISLWMLAQSAIGALGVISHHFTTLVM
jgi:hypothetical protein